MSRGKRLFFRRLYTLNTNEEFKYPNISIVSFVLSKYIYARRKKKKKKSFTYVDLNSLYTREIYKIRVKNCKSIHTLGM